jgi:hypothetical protein
LEPTGPRPLRAESQLAVLGRYGVEQSIGAGAILCADGHETNDIIVLLVGFVDIVGRFSQPNEDVLIIYRPTG